jgi:hypothetical protein
MNALIAAGNPYQVELLPMRKQICRYTRAVAALQREAGILAKEPLRKEPVGSGFFASDGALTNNSTATRTLPASTVSFAGCSQKVVPVSLADSIWHSLLLSLPWHSQRVSKTTVRPLRGFPRAE